MSKILSLTLSATDIYMAVKSDTYITGQTDKNADMVKNAGIAFNEQAGEEKHHKFKLYRTMKGALAKFAAGLAEYVETSEVEAAVSDTLTPESTTFVLSLTVNDRTSAAFVTTLAYLAQEFIINTMLYYWWQSIKPELAKDYLAFAVDNIADARRCLAKSAPTVSEESYGNVSGSITPYTQPSTPTEYVAFTEESQEINTFEDIHLNDNFVCYPVGSLCSLYQQHGNLTITAGSETGIDVYIADEELLQMKELSLPSGTGVTEFTQGAGPGSLITLPWTLTEEDYNVLSSFVEDEMILFHTTQAVTATYTE